MWLEIAARRIIVPISFSMILFFWGPLSVVVRDFNLRTSEGSFFVLAAVCCVQLYVILALWEIAVFHSFVELQCRIDGIGRDAVRKRNVSLAIISIRLKRTLFCVQKILRQGWIIRGGDRANSVRRGLHSWSVRRFFSGLINLVLSAPVWLSIVCACVMLKSTNSHVGQLYEGVLYFVRGSVRVGDVVQGLLSRVPAIVALMPLLSLPAFLYFYSQKRNIRRAISRNKAAHVDEVALLFERLILWFDRNFDRLCLNFDYVVRMQRSLVDFQLKRIFPEGISGVQARRMFMGADELGHYIFLELDDADVLSKIVCELLDDRLKRYTRLFSASSDNLWEMYLNDLHILGSIKGIERAFFCKDAVKSLVSDRITQERRLMPRADEVGHLRDELEESLSWQIYDGLERLYRIQRASRALRRYLYSSRTETLILKVMSRDK